jgi:hypothetical protein
MKLFKSRTQRSITFVVLLVWLFGLATGVANACLLEAHEGHSGSHEFSALSAGADGAVASHDDHGPEASKAPCLKFCGDSANSAVKQQSTADSTHAGQVPFTVSARPVVTTAASPLVREADLRRPPPGPPIRVRFSPLLL